MRTPFVGGNWKMNTDAASAVALAAAVHDGLAASIDARACQVAIFPPFPYLLPVRDVLRSRGSTVMLGAQDCYFEPTGAFTGEVSISMLKDCGVQVVLTGHSERRHVIGETDDLVNRKTRAVLDSGLQCIFCIGEKLAEREAGQTDAVNQRQIEAGLRDVGREHLASGRLTIAYEPVWAIGTGRVATPSDAQDAHAKIRAVLGRLYGAEAAAVTRIQYGGSANAGNVRDLLAQPDIDGGLVGGASLKANDFVAVVRLAATMRESSVPAA